jgi:type IV secretion system protein VirB10
MAVEPQPLGDGVSAVARTRPHLSGRRKIAILGACGGAALAAIFVSHILGGAGEKGLDKGAENLVTTGMPFTAPAAPKPVPALGPVPAPRMPYSIPAMPQLVPHAGNGTDSALDAPIFSYSAGGGAPPAPGSSPGRALARTTATGTGEQGGVGDALSKALKSSDLGAPARAQMLPHPQLTIPAGAIIPCTLQTAINSELAGFVDCVLPAEVRGATGTVTLLDRGTQIFGEIRSGLRQGQDRLFILWVRARTPENVVVSLASPAADELGRAGVPGAVDNHFWQRFGAAILFSVIGYGPQIAANAVQHGSGNNYIQFLTPQQELANTVLESQINIPPTLEKNQGDTVSIFVARDLDFSSVYDLRAQP